MNIERSALRGEKAVNEQKLKELRHKADGMRNLLRLELPSYLDVAALNAEKIGAYGQELSGLVGEIQITIETLKKIEEQLNG
jgi:hypothetical protein